MYILECCDWVMGVDIYKKKGFFCFILKIDCYWKFEDLRIFFEEFNFNIKDVEEMRKKRNKFIVLENC